MAGTRTFDYNAVSSVYNEIKKITTGSDSIKTILDKINNEYHNSVDVENEAVYGELGRQLLLDWDNTSSNFPNFVNNFENWSALIAKASGNYSEFENAIAGFKQDHMLGATSEAGRTTAYTNDGYYAHSIAMEDLDTLASYAQFHELTGATYVDTGMVSFAKKYKAWNAVEDILNVAAIVSAGFTVASYVKNVAGFTQAGTSTAGLSGNVGGFRGGISQAGASTAGKVGSHMANSGFWQRFASTGFGSKVANGTIHAANALGKTRFFLTHLSSYGGAGSSMLSASRLGITAAPVLATSSFSLLGEIASFTNYTPEYYLTGNYNVTKVVGDTEIINGEEYTFFGKTSSGVNLYVDNTDACNLLYKDANGALINVVNENNESATLNNIDVNSKIYINGSYVGTYDDIDYEVDEISPDIKDYNDKISNYADSLLNNTEEGGI